MQTELNLNNVDQIIDAAKMLGIESDKTVERHIKWEEFITPIFKEQTGFEYRYEYENMYSLENQKFIKLQRQKFNLTYEQHTRTK